MSTAKIDVYYAEEASILKEKLFAEMISHSGKWPDDRAFLLVPERQKSDLERAYLEKPGANGLMMAEILSFSRLAQRIFAEAGGAEAKTLSRAGKAMLIQRLLLKHEGEFRRFQRLAERPAFASEIAEVMGDFYRYDISVDALKTAATVTDSTVREITQDKLADFASLKEFLEAAFEQMELQDRDSNLDRACAIIENPAAYPRLDFLASAHVFVYGFGSERLLTVQERRIISALSRRVRALTIFVLSDQPGSNALPFEIGRRSLLEIMETYPRAELTQLASGKKQEAHIKLVLADSINDEVNYVAGDIRALLFEGKYRRRDIAVGLCEIENTPAEVEAAFNEFGIAAYMDTGRSLSQSSCLRALAQILELSLNKFSFAAAMQYLRCGLTGLKETDIDAFENVCFSAGINNAASLKRFCDLQDRQKSRYEKLSDDREISFAVRQVCAHLREIFTFGAEMRQQRTARGKLELLAETLLGSGSRIFNAQTFQGRVEAEKGLLLQNDHEQEALNLVAAWNALVDLVAEARLVFQNERVSQKHFVQLFMAGLEGLSLSSIPLGIDRVRVGTVTQIIDYPAKVFYILGADSDNFPPRGPSEGFLRDEEREWLSQHSDAKLPQRLDNLAVTQALLIYRLEQQAESLRISAATKSEDELSLQVQSWKNATDSECVLLEDEAGPDARWNIYKYARRNLEVSHDRHKHTLWRNAVRLIEQRSGSEAKTTLNINFLQLPGLFVLEDHSYDILRPQQVSISAIQRYNRCPFQYFIDYGLNLQERDIAKDNPREQGSFVHRLLELALLDLQAQLAEAAPAARSRIIEEWRGQIDVAYLRGYYDQVVQEAGFFVYGRPEMSGMIGERMIQHAVNTLLLSTSSLDDANRFYPYALEWKFPQENDPDPFALDVDGEKVLLRGLIDRVDIEPNGQKYRLYDFKRSERSNKKNLVGLIDGTDIQLQIYRKVWQHAHPQMQVDASLLLFFQNNAENNRKRLSHVYQAEDQYLHKLRNEVKKQQAEHLEIDTNYALLQAENSIRSIRQGFFAAQPKERTDNDGGSPCKFCAYRGLCYYEPPSRPPVQETTKIKDLEELKLKRLSQNAEDYA